MRTLLDQFTHIIALLHHAIGLHLHREATRVRVVFIGHRSFAPRPDPTAPAPLPEAVWTLLYQRTLRLRNRFHALYLRWQTNTLPKPRPSRARAEPSLPPAPSQGGAGGGPLAPTPEPKPLRLPRAFGWINKRIPEAAPPAGTLEDLLFNRAEEVQSLLQAAPQAGRYLRPLAHALGIRAPAYLRLPRRPGKPRTTARKKPSPLGGLSREADQGRVRGEAAPALKLTDPLLNLRPYVIRAARAWKKRDGEA